MKRYFHKAIHCSPAAKSLQPIQCRYKQEVKTIQITVEDKSQYIFLILKDKDGTKTKISNSR